MLRAWTGLSDFGFLSVVDQFYLTFSSYLQIFLVSYTYKKLCIQVGPICKEVNMSPFVQRMVRAAKLDVNLYEEVEADETAMKQAMGVVVLSSVAAGIGSVSMGIGSLIFGTMLALLGWFLWAYITFFIGTKMLPEPQTKSSYGELLRTIGFSSSPGLIRVLGIIPGFGQIVFTIAGVWMLVDMVIAVRQALDYKSTGRAIGVCAIGWLFQAIIIAILIAVAGGSGV